MPDTVGYDRNQKIRSSMSKEMTEKVKHAVDRFRLGRDYRQRMRETAWRDAYAQYMGSTNYGARYSPDDDTADVVNINMSFSTINTLVPFVADEDPEFLIEPDSQEASAQSAAMLTAFLNGQWRAPDFRGSIHLSDATFDYLTLGDGYLKAGYEIVDKIIYDGAGDIVGENRVPVAKFSLERVNPWDVWIDPYADGIHNARWVCHRILMPASEVRKDKRYKIVDQDKFSGSQIDHQSLSPEDQDRLDQVQDWVAVYEFYDIKERCMIAFLLDGDMPIRYIEGITCPIVQMGNYRIPNSPYHMGDLEQVRSLQDELNKTRSQMMTHRRRNVLKWVVNEHKLTDDAVEAMKSSIVNDVIRVQVNEPLDNIIKAIDPVPISADSYNIEASIRGDINEITGVNEYLRGAPQEISRTATEASIIEGTTNIRTRHKLLQVEAAAATTGQILLGIMIDVLPLTRFQELSQYVTGKQAEKINRAMGLEDPQQDVLLTPDPEIFQGRYRVFVQRGSTEIRNPQAKAQKIREVAVVMINSMPLFLEIGMPFNLQRMLVQWFEAEGIDDPESLFEADEQQQMMMALKMMEQAQAAQPQPTGGEAGVGARTPSGQPRPQTSQPPSDITTPANSGMLPGRSY